MVDLMIANPDWNHAELAAYFGRSPGFMAAVLASDAFQQVLEPRRHEVVDPTLAATLDERFRALAIRSATVLQHKLEASDVNDLTVLKALEVGAKALGMGLKKPQEDLPQLAAPQTGAQAIADKIMQAMQARKNAEAVDVEAKEIK
jgi:stress-induced morphogen